MKVNFSRGLYTPPRVEVIVTEYDAAVALTNATGHENELHQLAKKRGGGVTIEDDNYGESNGSDNQLGNPWTTNNKSLWDD